MIKKTLAILAGGKSSRMGYQNKALLKYKDKTFIEHLINAGRDFEEVIIVANNPKEYEKHDIKVVKDIYKEKGPLGGIHAALTNSKFEKVLCVACDMPFMNRETLNKMALEDEDYDILISKSNDKFQPLCSIYSKKLIKKIEERLLNNQNKMQSFIFEQKYKIIENKFDNDSFININTKEEYKNLKEQFMFTVGIITSSDKGSKGEREDKSGAVIEEIVSQKGFKVIKKVIVPDEKELLQKEMIDMADNLKLNLVLTTGGTGFSKRDITPEATKEVIEREAPGIVEAIRYYSLQITKRAMLSRAVSGIRKDTLIINLPGSPKACKEALDFVLDDVKHGIEILLGQTGECARK